MAIQVGGTTVIDNTPNLVNVGGLKTINGTSILGSGNISAGASTTNGAVGTYGFFGPAALGYWPTAFPNGSTTSGSDLRWQAADNGGSSSSPSGTWQCMGYGWSGLSGRYGHTLWVRIS